MDRLIALTLVACACALFVPAETNTAEQFVYNDPTAAVVQLVGDWNEWGGLTDATGTANPSIGLMRNDSGVWVIPVPSDLRKGRYRYAFLVNGSRLVPDPLNPERTFFVGREVSVFVVD